MASLLAVQPVIMQGRNSFELYGYDILLDEDLTPWLLEVNASPALTGTDSEDYRLKFDLIDDTLNVLDFEGRFTGRETRIGGFDLLWNDGPVWTTCPNPGVCGEPFNDLRKLNIFLGARNDRVDQLRQLREYLNGRRNKTQSSRRDATGWTNEGIWNVVCETLCARIVVIAGRLVSFAVGAEINAICGRVSCSHFACARRKKKEERELAENARYRGICFLGCKSQRLFNNTKNKMYGHRIRTVVNLTNIWNE